MLEIEVAEFKSSAYEFKKKIEKALKLIDIITDMFESMDKEILLTSKTFEEWRKLHFEIVCLSSSLMSTSLGIIGLICDVERGDI